MMKHIQQEFEGSSIQRWEVEHGIVRIVRGNCEYVICMDWDGFQQKQAQERDLRRREYIAEQQAAAYFGGNG